MTAQVSRPTPPASRINGDTNRTGTPIGQEHSWPDLTNRRPYGLRPSWPRSGDPLSPLRKLRRQLLYPSRAVERCAASPTSRSHRSEEHTSELQSRFDLVCRLLLEKKNRL